MMNSAFKQLMNLGWPGERGLGSGPRPTGKPSPDLSSAGGMFTEMLTILTRNRDRRAPHRLKRTCCLLCIYMPAIDRSLEWLQVHAGEASRPASAALCECTCVDAVCLVCTCRRLTDLSLLCIYMPAIDRSLSALSLIAGARAVVYREHAFRGHRGAGRKPFLFLICAIFPWFSLIFPLFLRLFYDWLILALPPRLSHPLCISMMMFEFKMMNFAFKWWFSNLKWWSLYKKWWIVYHKWWSLYKQWWTLYLESWILYL